MQSIRPQVESARWRWLGPVCVAVGAGLWGTETLYRLHLNERFAAGPLVFYEHLFILALMIPVMLRHWRGIFGHAPRTYVYLLFSGVLGSAMGAYFFTKGLGLMAPTAANLLLNVQPVFGALAAYTLLKERIARTYPLWAGLCLIAGGVLSVKNVADLWSGNTLQGIVYILLTAFCWGVSTAIGRAALLSMHSLSASIVRLFVGTACMWTLCLLQGTPPSVADLREIFAAAPQVLQVGLLAPNLFKDFLLLAAFAGALPLVVYFKGLAHTPASVGTFCEMVQTLAALIVTWGILGDALVAHQLIAAVVLLIAVYRLNVAQQSAAEAAVSAPTAVDA